MRTLCVTTVLLALAAESPGIGQPIIVEHAALPTARVIYADLNLHSDAGRQALEFRVRRAADSLCFEGGRTDLVRSTIEHDCYRKAIASAQPQIDVAVGSFDVVTAAAAITVSAR
jgi:UrcA family protein